MRSILVNLFDDRLQQQIFIAVKQFALSYFQKKQLINISHPDVISIAKQTHQQMERTQFIQDISAQLNNRESQHHAIYNHLQSSRAFSEQQYSQTSQMDSIPIFQPSIHSSLGFHVGELHSSSISETSFSNQTEFNHNGNQNYCVSYHIQATQISILKRELQGLSGIILNQESILVTRRQKATKVRQIIKICQQKHYELLLEVKLELEKADIISTKLLTYTQDKMFLLVKFYNQLKDNYHCLTNSKWEQYHPEIKQSDKLDKLGVVKSTINIGCDSLNIFLHVQIAKVYPPAIVKQFKATWEKTELALSSALKDIYNETTLQNLSIEMFANLQTRVPMKELLQIEKKVGIQLCRAEKVINQQQIVSKTLLEGVLKIMDLYLSAQDLKLQPDAICHFSCAWMKMEKLAIMTEQRFDSAVEYYNLLLAKLERIRQILRNGY